MAVLIRRMTCKGLFSFWGQRRDLPSRTSTLFPLQRSAFPFLNCNQVSNLFKEFSGKLTSYTQKRATCFATLWQNELKSGVARFTTHVQTCLQPDLVQDRFLMGGKTCNITIQLVLEQCCNTSCKFFVACFSVVIILSTMR